MTNNIISIKDLSKVYDGGVIALNKINLNIESGEIISLLGPNGAGKTTLISSICGITNISSGSVKVNNFNVQKDYRKTRALIGLVPQEISLEPFERVIDVVKYSRNLFGLKNDDNYIKGILKKLLLWEKKDSRIMQLSGGMKRRVLIAKALSHNPKILFLDEPTAGVDVDLRVDMWKIIKKLQSDGVTIILTTHYIEEAEEISDRISIINKGEILLTENKKKLIEMMGQKTISIKVKNTKSLDNIIKSHNLSFQPYDDHIELKYNYKKNENMLNDILKSLIDKQVQILNIDTQEKSLEEIFRDIVNN